MKQPLSLQEILHGWPTALGSLLVYLGVSWIAWKAIRTLLPRQRIRLVPWTGLELVAILLMHAALIQAMLVVVTSTGLGEALYGRETMEALQKQDSAGHQFARMRLGVLVSVLAFPFQLLVVPVFLRHFSGTRPFQLGLTTHRWKQNALLGGLGWLILTPAVLGLFALVSWLFGLLSPEGVREHDFEQLSKSPVVTSVEVALIVFVALVTAPLIEELLFRGLLLPWLAERPGGSHGVMGLCLLAGLPLSAEKWELLQQANSPAALVLILAPALFVLVLLPAYWLVCRRQETYFPTALFATSLLFAMIHSAWPAPVPLFVLALGLGWLARRTQSLVGPMVLHSLFNGVASIQIVLGR